MDLRGIWGNPLVKIYVEGGGDSKDLKTRCREGFSSFFRKAGLAGHMPRIIACGGRQQAFERFCVALKSNTEGEFVVLLVDSEDPVADGAKPWQHLAGRDRWERPSNAMDEHAHFMVQCMEAWFLADADGLADYYGRGFNRNALPGRREIDEVPKEHVLRGLQNATRRCAKGEYGKGRHSFGILGRIHPTRVIDASPYARRLIETLRGKAIG